MNNNYRCQHNISDEIGVNNHDPEEDKYKPENAIVWFGWCIVAMLFGAFMWWVLS